jgi:hypothetical protein
MHNGHEHRDGNGPLFGRSIRTFIPIALLSEDLTNIVYVLRRSLTMRTTAHKNSDYADQQEYTGSENVFSKHRESNMKVGHRRSNLHLPAPERVAVTPGRECMKYPV